MTGTHWTLSFIIGTPVWIVFLLALIILAALCIKHPDGEVRGFGIGCIVVFVVALAVALSPLGYYPYKAEYHQWRPVSGKVTQVSSRLIGEDKSVSQRFVLVIGGQPYGVDDTRASTVKVGDTVALSCRRDWQYASVPGYVCRWNQ